MPSTDPSLPMETVLIVEDYDNDALLLKHCFQRIDRPYALQFVGNGLAAINYLAGREVYRNREKYPFPSVLFLDMNLPLVDGDQVLDWLRKNELPEKLLVFLLTGHVDNIKPIELLETHGKTCIVRSRFLKPPTLQSVRMMLTFYQTWKRQSQDNQPRHPDGKKELC